MDAPLWLWLAVIGGILVMLAIDLVAQGRIDLKPLVTHRYSFDQAVEAFQATRAGKSPDGKAVIKAVISGPDVDPADLL